MFRFTIRDVLWLMVVVGCFGCSSTLGDSAAGRNLIQQIESAETVTVKHHVESVEIGYDLAPDARSQLVAWMKKAKRDHSPKKYVVRATIDVPPKRSWHVLSISGVEVGLRIDIDNYWRGLDRAEFERIVSHGQATH